MFYDNLKAICDKMNIKITPLVVECGGTKGVISGWKRGAAPNSDIVMRLSVRLSVPTDVLLFGEEKHPLMELSDDEKHLFSCYRELSAINKGIVIGKAETLLELEKTTKTEGNANNKKSPKNRADNTVLIDLYTLPASAGTGVMLDDSDTEPIEVDADYLSDTKNYYAIRVSGNSMEPEFQDGDIVLVEATPKIDEGEIGIFILNNEEGFIKKLGHGCLISLNSKYEPIELDDDDELLCRGRVLGVLDI
ncbi:MAG: S24 family peptidase [Ruminococcus sp.]|nr:S24 family peptidase [Ruminococcus sp.]